VPQKEDGGRKWSAKRGIGAPKRRLRKKAVSKERDRCPQMQVEEESGHQREG